MNKLKQTDLKGQHNFSLFICGGPRHCFSFKQCSGDLILLRQQFVVFFLNKCVLLRH